MSLDTYDNLKIEIIDWSHRSDLDKKIDTFIDLAEKEMYQNPISPLKVRSGETRSTATTSGRYLALPDGFVNMRRLRLELNDVNSNLIQQAPEQMRFVTTTGTPQYFTVTSQLEFDRDPDGAYEVEMQFFAEFTPLSDSNQTNPILTNSPNIYLFGALKELYSWTNDTENEVKYEAKFMNAILGANKLDRKGRYGPAPSMRIEGSTP